MSIQPGEGPPEPARLRASNEDRERVAAVLNQAMAEGRISVPELQERLDAVYQAKTLGELEPVTRDLPGHQLVVPAAVSFAKPAARSPRIGGTPTSTTAIAVLGGAERKGEWVVPQRFTAVAIMGGVDLNLTRARFAGPEVTITAVAIMGGIDIIVPDDVIVRVDGVGLMGGFDHTLPEVGELPPGAPVVRITGVAVMGGVDVHRPKRRPRRQLDQG